MIRLTSDFLDMTLRTVHASAIYPLLSGAERRAEYAERGGTRAGSFTWRETARNTRQVLHEAALGA